MKSDVDTMPPEDDRTQQLPGATVATSPVADPLASTLSVRPGPPAALCAAQPGRELGAVRLLREIGRGSTGSVFLGHHTVLGRDVAVKFLLTPHAGRQDRAGLKRFLDEARAAAAVRHPNLTQIYHADVDDADGTPYLVLEYVSGPTLKQLLDQAGPLDAAAAVAVVCDAAAAVHELHARGLIHRDIKPSNVLVDGDARVYVTDFGLAVRQAHGAAAGGAAAGPGTTSEFAGTPAYMAPEMFDGRVSPRTDVYALGVTTFQLLAGSVPYSGSFDELRDRHAREPLPSDALRARGVRPEVVEVLERCTNKQPMFRYKTPTDFSRALKQAAACAEPEVRRGRKWLCDCVAGRLRGGGSSDPEPTGASRAEGGEDERAGSSSYPEVLARFATVRRERRSHAPLAGEGSSAFLKPADPPPAAQAPGGLPPLVAPAAPPGLDPGVLPDAPPALTPGPVLAASVLGILYGSLLAAWVFGEAVGLAAATVPALGPRTGSAPAALAIWRVLVSLVGLVLAMVLVGASAGCLRLRPWARRLMVRYAAVDLVFQALVMLSVFAWAGPVTARAMASAAAAAEPARRAALELSVHVAWMIRWVSLSLFPAAVLFVMTRRHVRDAFPESVAP